MWNDNSVFLPLEPSEHHEMTQREELPDERDLGGVGIVRVGSAC